MSDSHPMLTRPEFNPVPTQDRDQLKLLGVFYYVFAGLLAIGGCCSSIYIVMGFALANAPSTASPEQNGPPPAALGWMFAAIGSCAMLIMLGIAGLMAYAAYCLQHQRRRTFCIVMAAISCLSVPLGTILGVFTLVVLLRPSAAALFEQVAAEQSPQTPPT